jgi:hypothetical protein
VATRRNRHYKNNVIFGKKNWRCPKDIVKLYLSQGDAALRKLRTFNQRCRYYITVVRHRGPKGPFFWSVLKWMAVIHLRNLSLHIYRASLLYISGEAMTTVVTTDDNHPSAINDSRTPPTKSLEQLNIIESAVLSDENLSTLEAVISKLRDNIWFTRKAWINAEKRLLNNDLHAQFLLVAYSIYSIALSVIVLKVPMIEADVSSVFSISLSVGILGASLFLATRSFKDRASAFKASYISLQELALRLDQIDWAITLKEKKSLYLAATKEYTDILKSTENHSEFDDLYARFTAKNLTTRTLTNLECAWVLLNVGLRLLVLALMYFAPIVCFLLQASN